MSTAVQSEDVKVVDAVREIAERVCSGLVVEMPHLGIEFDVAEDTKDVESAQTAIEALIFAMSGIPVSVSLQVRNN